MSHTRTPALALMTLLVLGAVTWTLTGCGGGGGGTSGGTGQLQLTLVDAPLGADAIYVDITKIEAHKSGAGWATVREYDTPLHVNLLDYSTSGSSLLLADTPLTAGHYTMIRLLLSGAEIVIGGTPHPVDLTNVAQNGAMCNGQFTVEDGQLVAITVDFSAAKSFVNNPPGSANYKLHPVLVMSPKNIASEVTGIVEFKDAGGAALPVPADTMVNVYKAGLAGDATALVSGAQVNADGTFRISVLPQGTYDLEVVANGGVVKTLAGFGVTPPATDLGTITVQETAQP